MEIDLSACHQLGTGTEFTWTASGKQKFLARQWLPKGEVRGVLLAVHGLSGAAQDFGPLGVRLSQQGWGVYAPELRGQGRDPVLARRGDLSSLQDWYDDLDAFVQLLREFHPQVPWLVAGESMGAALALHWLSRSRPHVKPSGAELWSGLRGLVLFSPVVAVAQKVTLWQRILFHGLSWVFPKKKVRLGDFAPQEEQDLRVTRDEAYQEYIYTAPHHLDSYSLRFVRHLEALIQGCENLIDWEHLPILVQYAENDVFIRPSFVEAYFERLSARDKTKFFYAGCFHCLFHDLEADRALDEVELWLENHLAGPS